MNRRNFLKKIGITCATAVVAPTALVKVDPWKRLEVLRAQNRAEGWRVEHRKWVNYYNGWQAGDPELLEKFRAAFRNTKFIPPLRK